jgi:hypothetical protein
MKYILILYLCSFANSTPTVIQQYINPTEYPTYYDCISDGYISSYSSLMKIGVEQVNKQVLAVKFECKEVNTS